MSTTTNEGQGLDKELNFNELRDKFEAIKTDSELLRLNEIFFLTILKEDKEPIYRQIQERLFYLERLHKIPIISMKNGQMHLEKFQD